MKSIYRLSEDLAQLEDIQGKMKSESCRNKAVYQLLEGIVIRTQATQTELESNSGLSESEKATFRELAQSILEAATVLSSVFPQDVVKAVKQRTRGGVDLSDPSHSTQPNDNAQALSDECNPLLDDAYIDSLLNGTFDPTQRPVKGNVTSQLLEKLQEHERSPLLDDDYIDSLLNGTFCASKQPEGSSAEHRVSSQGQPHSPQKQQKKDASQQPAGVLTRGINLSPATASAPTKLVENLSTDVAQSSSKPSRFDSVRARAKLRELVKVLRDPWNSTNSEVESQQALESSGPKPIPHGLMGAEFRAKMKERAQQAAMRRQLAEKLLTASSDVESSTPSPTASSSVYSSISTRGVKIAPPPTSHRSEHSTSSQDNGTQVMHVVPSETLDRVKRLPRGARAAPDMSRMTGRYSDKPNLHKQIADEIAKLPSARKRPQTTSIFSRQSVNEETTAAATVQGPWARSVPRAHRRMHPSSLTAVATTLDPSDVITTRGIRIPRLQFEIVSDGDLADRDADTSEDFSFEDEPSSPGTGPETAQRPQRFVPRFAASKQDGPQSVLNISPQALAMTLPFRIKRALSFGLSDAAKAAAHTLRERAEMRQYMDEQQAHHIATVIQMKMIAHERRLSAARKQRRLQLQLQRQKYEEVKRRGELNQDLQASSRVHASVNETITKASRQQPAEVQQLKDHVPTPSFAKATGRKEQKPGSGLAPTALPLDPIRGVEYLRLGRWKRAPILVPSSKQLRGRQMVRRLSMAVWHLLCERIGSTMEGQRRGAIRARLHGQRRYLDRLLRRMALRDRSLWREFSGEGASQGVDIPDDMPLPITREDKAQYSQLVRRVQSATKSSSTTPSRFDKAARYPDSMPQGTVSELTYTPCSPAKGTGLVEQPRGYTFSKTPKQHESRPLTASHLGPLDVNRLDSAVRRNEWRGVPWLGSGGKSRFLDESKRQVSLQKVGQSQSTLKVHKTSDRASKKADDQSEDAETVFIIERRRLADMSHTGSDADDEMGEVSDVDLASGDEGESRKQPHRRAVTFHPFVEIARPTRLLRKRAALAPKPPQDPPTQLYLDVQKALKAIYPHVPSARITKPMKELGQRKQLPLTTANLTLVSDLDRALDRTRVGKRSSVPFSRLTDGRLGSSADHSRTPSPRPTSLTSDSSISSSRTSRKLPVAMDCSIPIELPMGQSSIQQEEAEEDFDQAARISSLLLPPIRHRGISLPSLQPGIDIDSDQGESKRPKEPRSVPHWQRESSRPTIRPQLAPLPRSPDKSHDSIPTAIVSDIDSNVPDMEARTHAQRDQADEDVISTTQSLNLAGVRDRARTRLGAILSRMKLYPDDYADSDDEAEEMVAIERQLSLVSPPSSRTEKFTRVSSHQADVWADLPPTFDIDITKETTFDLDQVTQTRNRRAEVAEFSEDEPEDEAYRDTDDDAVYEEAFDIYEEGDELYGGQGTEEDIVDNSQDEWSEEEEEWQDAVPLYEYDSSGSEISTPRFEFTAEMVRAQLQKQPTKPSLRQAVYQILSPRRPTRHQLLRLVEEELTQLSSEETAFGSDIGEHSQSHSARSDLAPNAEDSATTQSPRPTASRKRLRRVSFGEDKIKFI